MNPQKNITLQYARVVLKLNSSLAFESKIGSDSHGSTQKISFGMYARGRYN
jgi:hypothetical protein